MQSTAEFGASERRNGAREDGLHPGRCGGYVCARPHEAISERPSAAAAHARMDRTGGISRYSQAARGA